MMNFTQTTEMKATNIKAAAKAEVLNTIIEALKTVYGDENVQMVRHGSGDSKTNEIGVLLGTVTNGTGIHDMVVTVGATAKEYDTRKTKSRVYEAFNFEAAVNEYNEYVENKAVGKKKS